ncbi:MAG: hypothetical protein OXI64_08200 [Defluviicoccus sp.]|nr:hypothetical protein [Defluviicoccus sp.]
MSKYEPLATYLRECGDADVSMTFAEIEGIIRDRLPPSAFRHRPWWSNNPSNSVITRAWLAAGYISAEVDMTERKLVFRKSGPDGPLSDAGDAGPPTADPEVAEIPRQSIASRIADALKGTVTVKPGTDLTEPVDTKWDATR